MKVMYDLDGVAAEVKKILNNKRFESDKLGGIFEFDQENYKLRCRGTDASPSHCGTQFIIATTRSLERRPIALIPSFEPFINACHKLRASHPDAACFWLR